LSGLLLQPGTDDATVVLSLDRVSHISLWLRGDGNLAQKPIQGDVMVRKTLEERVLTLEQQMIELRDLPVQMRELRSEFSQLRTEMRDEFSAIRSEMATRAGLDPQLQGLRAEMVAGDEETRRQMRVLHEDLVSRIALLHEARPPRSRRRKGR